MNNELIIIGGGPSIKTGVDQGLFTLLKRKFTFGLNFSYHYLTSTAQIFVDNTFYNQEFKTLKDLPLIIGRKHSHLKIHPNTIMMPVSSQYDISLEKGVYKSSLCGIFALSLGIYLLNDLKDPVIYLLGYDYGDNGAKKNNVPVTHFYQGDIQHRGIGKVNYYNNVNRADRDFQPFLDNQIKVKIYNISLNSKIQSFEKIDYETFFNKLNKNVCNQEETRKEIIKKLNERKSK